MGFDKEKILSRLDAMRTLCVSENREPTSTERKLARDMLVEFDTADARDFFDLGGNSGVTSQALTRGAVALNKPSDGFRCFGEFLQSVRVAGVPCGQVDQRLQLRAAGLSETIPSEGGFLVGQTYSDSLLRGAFDNANLAKLCTKFELTGNSNSMKLPAFDETSRATGSRYGGVQSYWITEAGEIQASKPKFKSLELSLKKLCGLCYCTDELLQDANNLERYVQQAFADEISFAMDDAIINGVGAGQPLGISNSGCLVSVAKETGQKAASVMLENIIKMWSRMLPRSRKNAVWLINQDIEPQLYSLSLAVGTGGKPVFLPAGGLSSEPYATLFGRPIIPCEQMATLGTVGDIMLADMSHYLLIDKGSVKSDVSIHVSFVSDQSLFRFVYRVDGQPAFSSPITPYKGTGNTLSPFVCLASRT